MSFANSLIGAFLDLVLSPLRDRPPVVGLAVASAMSAVVMLLVVRMTSDQVRLQAVKRSIHACVFEIRLFGDDAVAMVRALAEMIRHNLTYLRLSLVPLFVMALPFTLLLIHLDGYYGVRAPRPGDPLLLTVKMKEGDGPAPRLTAPAGVSIETPAIRIPSRRETVWRISAARAADYELTIAVGATSLTKRFTATDGIVRRPAVRPADRVLAQIASPAEPPLPRGAAIDSIRITYPSRRIGVFGWNVHWLVVFLALSAAFALALRSPLKVVL